MIYEMTNECIMMKAEVKKKGQITIPKKIRDNLHFEEGDVITFTELPGGDVILKRIEIKTSEDILMKILEKIPKFNSEKAWKEVEADRAKERS